jgi:hypothetical protein
MTKSPVLLKIRLEDESNLNKPHHLLVPSHEQAASNFQIGVNEAQPASEAAAKASSSHKVGYRSTELANTLSIAGS